MFKVYVCSNCNQKNRIDETADTSQAICSRCWALLDPPVVEVKAPPSLNEEPDSSSSGNKKTKADKYADGCGLFLTVSCLCFVGALMIASLIQEPSSTRSDTSKELAKRSKEPALNNSADTAIDIEPIPELEPLIPEKKLPLNGETKMFTSKPQMAPLKIQTSRGVNYLVKLVSLSNEPALTVFIRGGESVTLDVPLVLIKSDTHQVKNGLDIIISLVLIHLITRQIHYSPLKIMDIR